MEMELEFENVVFLRQGKKVQQQTQITYDVEYGCLVVCIFKQIQLTQKQRRQRLQTILTRKDGVCFDFWLAIIKTPKDI